MTGAVALAALAALICSAALAAGQSRPRKALSLTLASLALAPCWFMDDLPPMARGVASLCGELCLMRCIDLATDHREHPPAQRLWLAVATFDTRLVERVPRSLDAKRLGAVVAYGALAAGAFTVVTHTTSLAVRWLAGAVAVYAAADAAVATLIVAYRALGIALPPLHREPILSRSVAEFWSKRWNLTVHAWLRRHCYQPVARRWGVVPGLLAAFVVSALIHVAFTWPAAGTSMAALMGSFFVLQTLFVALERVVRPERLPRALGHLWTVALIGGASPLFVEPMLRIIFPP